jgi:hypothetical protein
MRGAIGCGACVVALALAGCDRAAPGDPPADAHPRTVSAHERWRNPLLNIPRIARVFWRRDAKDRFVTIVQVPRSGATESVWMTYGDRLVKVGELDPADRGEAAPVAEGPVEVRIVQDTEPATVTAELVIRYRPGETTTSAAALISARVTTEPH